VSNLRSESSEAIAAWELWLEEWAPGVRLDDDLGCQQLSEALAVAAEMVVPGQPMSRDARERWWRASLRVEADCALDLEADDDRARFAAQLALVVPAAPVKDDLGRWRVFGSRRG
jgi:hypothetical protein